MARRVFFSFHFDKDIWRANQVRNSNVIPGYESAGFFDHSEYNEAKKYGIEGIKRMIGRHLRNTSVTVVLIGLETASRPWVKYEIAKSVEQDNGLLGIRIHHLKNQYSNAGLFPGPTPTVTAGVEFPIYNWDGDLDRFNKAIEAAGKRSDSLRLRKIFVRR
jgi:hypothetical protein